MSNQEITLNPTEFGIDENRGLEIVNKFSPLQFEINAYNEQYKSILESELTEELTVKARDLRLKLKDIRTKQVNKIHKSEKDFYLQGGRFVDAWKNKLNTIIEVQEDKLQQIEDYFLNIEKQKIEDLRNSRWLRLKEYTDLEPNDLGLMSEDIFNATLNGFIQIEKEKELEQKRIEEEKAEEERILKLHNLRKEKTLPFFDFWNEEDKKQNLGIISESDFNTFFDRIQLNKKEFDIKQEEFRKENERLRLDAELKQKEIEKQQKIEAEKLRKEILEKEKLEAEIKANKIKLEKEEQAKKEEQERLRLEQEEIRKAPIKKQLSFWIDSFEIPDTQVENEITLEIKQKFESFLKWSKNKINEM